MLCVAADRDQRRIHDQRYARTNIRAGRTKPHLRRRNRLLLQSGQFDQCEQALHEWLVLQRAGHARIAHRHAVGPQSFAERTHSVVVVRDHSHVVPVAGMLQMLGFDPPDHVIQLLDGGAVHGGSDAAVIWRNTVYGDTRRHRFDR